MYDCMTVDEHATTMGNHGMTAHDHGTTIVINDTMDAHGTYMVLPWYAMARCIVNMP